jgi:hypothetical protein
MMKDEALKLALEALDNLARYADTCELFLKETHPGKANALRERVIISIKAITAIKQALEAPVQEPMTWVGVDFAIDCSPPAQRSWVGLTNDDIWEVYKNHDSMQYMEFSRAIEAKLKEKNT